jgi:replicative DNA helicase
VAVAEEVFSIGDALDAADIELSAGRTPAAAVLPTGFRLLDTYLGGGLRSGELCLLGGPQGLGKTAFVLQVARYVAQMGDAAVVMSFEHDATTLMERLIALEAGDTLGVDGVPLRRVREALEGGGRAGATLAQRLSSAQGAAEAIDALRGYADRLLLHRSSGTSTGLEQIREVARGVADDQDGASLLVVDYLQKVHIPDAVSEPDRISRIVDGLKDIALEYDLAVLAVSAVDTAAAGPGRRMRVAHLAGSSSLAYEPDVILMMNEKYDVVARHHLMYDARAVDRFRDHVVLSIEKNRSGLARIDLELRKRLEQSRFERDAKAVAEELLDERLYTE